ncbi:hypothetical protein [Alicyclobacillus sp. ALC3]|uniref:hypothetical protein n=1 Tax=Alicyclobacillus sp. ALC3 TaxID=2796143 RepID=UPI002378A5E7|nr:hypothetical protein [Alicyclobacillus sp. ALC3]WDL98466.1 hypothetical protein JC200_07225 [Alicyclobacillus sp. ALC3]
MSKVTKGFLAAALVLTVYLVYVIGYLVTSSQTGLGYVFPFFHLQTSGAAQTLLNISGGLCVVAWILWGIGFVSE